MAKESEQQKAANSPAFESYYLQRATQELAEDLDKVRNTNDFKPESIHFLVHALQQGSSQFSSDDQRRVVAALPSQDKN